MKSIFKFQKYYKVVKLFTFCLNAPNYEKYQSWFCIKMWQLLILCSSAILFCSESDSNALTWFSNIRSNVLESQGRIILLEHWKHFSFRTKLPRGYSFVRPDPRPAGPLRPPPARDPACSQWRSRPYFVTRTWATIPCWPGPGGSPTDLDSDHHDAPSSQY